MVLRAVLAKSPATLALGALLALAVVTLQYRELRRIFDDLSPDVKTGQKAPALEFSGLKGEAIVTTGRPTVVSFWAAWCAPCRREMPELAAEIAKWNEKAADGDRIELILVNVDEDPESISMFVNDQRLSKATFAADPTGAAKDRWKVKVLPTTYFVGRRGTIDYYREGYSPYGLGGFLRTGDTRASRKAEDAKP